MHPAHPDSAAEAWLAWLETTKVASCRTYLYQVYGLEPADADAVINTARWQVYRHWPTIESPLAYFWQTLRRDACAYRRRELREQQQQQAYVTWWHEYQQLCDSTTRQVSAVLEVTPPREGQLLYWFALGYDDAQVAAWLKTSPAAIRVRRHAAYRALRASLASSSSLQPRAAGHASGPVRAAARQ